jgi:tetratricopeptide (TPR) repeat protein
MGAEEAYLFHHALLRDAAYQMQMPHDRAQLHHYVLDAYECLYDPKDPIFSTLALTLSNHAGSAVALGMPSDSRREYGWLKIAFEHAERSHHHEDIYSIGNRILNHSIRDSFVDADFLLQVALASRSIGDAENAVVLADEARDVAEGDKRGYAISIQALIQRTLGNLDEAERLCEFSIANSQKSGDQWANSLRELATVRMLKGDLKSTPSLLDDAIEAHLKAGNYSGVARAELNIAVIKSRTGHPKLAQEMFSNALRSAQRGSDHSAVIKANQNLAAHLAQLGKTQEAIEPLAESVQLIRETGDYFSLGHALVSLGAVQVELDRHVDALKTLGEAVEINKEAGNEDLVGTAKLNMGAIHHKEGDLETAIVLTMESVACQSRANNVRGEAIARRTVADLLTRLGRVTEANSQLDKAEAKANQSGETRLVCLITAQRAITNVTNPLSESVVRNWENAVSQLIEMGDPKSVSMLKDDMHAACKLAGVSLP